MLHLPWPRLPLTWRKLQLANAAPSRAPAGFTLVELLVVIGIIGIISALSVPVVMRALARSRNAAIKAEIDMLHMAIMNYKNEYGSFPPCVDIAAARKHVQRVFPRVADVTTQITSPPTQETAIVGWLSGYTDSPQYPVTPGARKKLFDFDASRISSSTFYPPGKSGSPYIYTDAARYYISSNTLRPYVEVNQAGALFNSDTFQIVCAGRDEQWNTDDDLSNFWSGTRKEYRDSLND